MAKDPKKQGQNKDRDINSQFLRDLEKKVKKNDPSTGEDKPPLRKKYGSRGLLFALVTLGIFTFYMIGRPDPSQQVEAVSYSEFIQGVEEGSIKACLIINQERIHFDIDGIKHETIIPYLDQNLISLLLKHQIHIESKEIKQSIWKQVLISFIPWILLMVLVYFFFFRQFRSKAGGAFNFGKSKAKLVTHMDVKENFDDVQGCEEAKEELKEIVSFLKNSKKYTSMGAKIPRGILLVGSPGTGKTLLAKAVAGEAKVPFFSISGSDFVEMFVGVGASRVRDLFETGRQHAPCIVFIDEIDAVGRMRGAGYGGGHDEREQTLNQLLVEMDGFEPNQSVIMMAATNRADVLDKAILRPGRFDRQIVVDIPDVRGRKGILEIHARKVKLAKSVNLENLARATPGFTGADLANLINEAALLAARMGNKEVKNSHLEEARDKVMMGSERKSMIIDKKEKRMTAYHEAGHALIGILLKNTNRLHKISIIPRGQALGLTWFLPEDGVYSASQSKLKEELMVKFGGRAAEELIFREISTGAANDIETATKLARSMVCQYGMSRLGPIAFGDKDHPVFIGREVAHKEEYSEETARRIDKEVSRLLTEAYKGTVELLKKNIHKLKKLSERLIEKEAMDMEEVYTLLKMKAPHSEKL